MVGGIAAPIAKVTRPVAVNVGVEESVTETVNWTEAVVVGVPEIELVALTRDKPLGKLPLVMVHV